MPLATAWCQEEQCFDGTMQSRSRVLSTSEEDDGSSSASTATNLHKSIARSNQKRSINHSPQFSPSLVVSTTLHHIMGKPKQKAPEELALNK